MVILKNNRVFRLQFLFPTKDKLKIIAIFLGKFLNDIAKLQLTLCIPNFLFFILSFLIFIHFSSFDGIKKFQIDWRIFFNRPQNLRIFNFFILTRLLFFFGINPILNSKIVVVILIPLCVVNELQFEKFILKPCLGMVFVNNLNSKFDQKTLLKPFNLLLWELTLSNLVFFSFFLS